MTSSNADLMYFPDDSGPSVDETGLENEEQDPIDPITEPFDPEKVDIRTVPVLIGQLVSRIEHREIDLSPEFQRLRGIWDPKRRSRLIESLLLRIPIPVFYVAASEDDAWSVVDGLQRMSTIFDYATGEFALSNLEYLEVFNRCKYDDLPRLMQRRINETQLIVNVIERGTPRDAMFNVFLRINTGGMTLNRQEIRHAIHSGPIRAFLQQLADSEEFLKATGGSIKKDRMADRECVLRFLAFYLTPPEEYAVNDLDKFLSNTMSNVNSLSCKERLVVGENFKKAMVAAYDIFAEDAFRKRTNEYDMRRPVNRALFEVWSVNLARHSPEQIEVIVVRSDEVKHRFMDLMRNDRDFDRAISLATGTPQRVQKRFKAIAQVLEDLLSC